MLAQILTCMSGALSTSLAVFRLGPGADRIGIELARRLGRARALGSGRRFPCRACGLVSRGRLRSRVGLALRCRLPGQSEDGYQQSSQRRHVADTLAFRVIDHLTDG
jgi:hypothetical protein